MKLILRCTMVLATYVAMTRSNPHPRKGELMEVVILKETQGNYQEALNAFAEIGKLARNTTVNLSLKERKLFYICYHFRRLQMLKDVIDSENYLNKDVATSIMDLFVSIESIYQDLSIHKEKQERPEFDAFLTKLNADKSRFDTWYFSNHMEVSVLQTCLGNYDQALPLLIQFLGDADITVLDTYLAYSSTKLELDTVYQAPVDSLPCDKATTGLVNGKKASSESNPDLIPLTQFVNSYCKPNPPNILDTYSFKRRQ